MANIRVLLVSVLLVSAYQTAEGYPASVTTTSLPASIATAAGIPASITDGMQIGLIALTNGRQAGAASARSTAAAHTEPVKYDTKKTTTTTTTTTEESSLTTNVESNASAASTDGSDASNVHISLLTPPAVSTVPVAVNTVPVAVNTVPAASTITTNVNAEPVALEAPALNVGVSTNNASSGVRTNNASSGVRTNNASSGGRSSNASSSSGPLARVRAAMASAVKTDTVAVDKKPTDAVSDDKKPKATVTVRTDKASAPKVSVSVNTSTDKSASKEADVVPQTDDIPRKYMQLIE